MSKPKNKELYSRVKSQAKKKFKGDWPSAYGSAWLVREYKKRGGSYKDGGVAGCECNSCETCAREKTLEKFADGGLTRWFKEEWTKPSGEACGSEKGKEDAKCRPSKRVSSETPKTWGEMSKSQRRKAISDKNKATSKGQQFSKYRLKK